MSRRSWSRTRNVNATFPSPGKSLEDVPVDEPVVARVGVGEPRELAAAPVEGPGVDDHTADRGPVAADVLRRREDHDVRAVRDRVDESHRGRVVHDQGDAVLVRDRGQGIEVGDVELRVAEGLDVDRLRLLRDRGAEGPGFGRVDELYSPAESGERDCEEGVGPPVEVVAATISSPSSVTVSAA